MSQTLFFGLFTAEQLAAVHAGGHVIEQLALSEGQKLVAHLKSTSIGAVVTADIAALKDETLTGAAKFEKVVGPTTPLVLSYIARGGWAAFAGNARELLQSLFDDPSDGAS